MRKKLVILTFALAAAAASTLSAPAKADTCPKGTHLFVCPTSSFCCPNNALCFCLNQ